MTTDDSQDQVMSRRSIRRQRRADEQRRRALSPVRILVMVMALPLTTAIIAVGTYFRATERDRPEAVLHLVALAGCDVTQAMGFGAFREGEAGYHKRNDPDGNGIACDRAAPASAPTQSILPGNEAPKQRMVGNAKFVRP